MGNVVKAAINGKTEKGDEFMSTVERPEMEFVIGKGQLTPGEYTFRYNKSRA